MYFYSVEKPWEKDKKSRLITINFGGGYKIWRDSQGAMMVSEEEVKLLNRVHYAGRPTFWGRVMNFFGC